MLRSTDTRPYDRVEGLHLRQWTLRVVPPLAALATNGASWIDVPALPAWDAPLVVAGLPASAAAWCSVAGGGLVALSAVLRVLAKGVLVRKTTVTRTGVYGLVRHPFYLANLLGAVGTFALAGPLGACAAAPWLAVALAVFLVTIDGEERGLRRIHGEAWDAYAACVPRLVPFPRPPGARTRGTTEEAPSGGRVTWRNLVEEGEPPRGLRFLGAAGLVLAFRLGGTAGTVAGAVAAALWGSSHVVARWGRRRAG